MQPTISQVIKRKKQGATINRFNFIKKMNLNALMQMTEKQEFRDSLQLPEAFNLHDQETDCSEFAFEKRVVQTVRCLGESCVPSCLYDFTHTKRLVDMFVFRPSHLNVIENYFY